jgi:hypothetical protein
VSPRNPLLVTHSVARHYSAHVCRRSLAATRDADDLDHPRTDPGVKLACGRLPDSGTDLCSQPPVSRWENAPTLREAIRMTYALIDTYCVSYKRPPRAVTLDIDDRLGVVHGEAGQGSSGEADGIVRRGHQQLSRFNAHYDERCLLPKSMTPPHRAPWPCCCAPARGRRRVEIRGHLRRMVRRIRSQWPDTRLTIRGDGHYARLEVMEWCEANGLD